jgi:hypothetical protein
MFSVAGISHQGASAGPTNFGGMIYAYQTIVGDPGGGIVYFSSDGSVIGSAGSNAGETVIIDTLSGENWYVPNTTGIGSSYWIKATVTSGAQPSGTSVGLWVSLSSTASWGNFASGDGSVSSSTLFVQISSSATGTPVVASGNVTLIIQIASSDSGGGGGGGGQLP